ncbi:MAG: hypothetical protein JXJ22_15950 [Bacteroidales bacterium]|nr:hypothetical protein [Bacteroidales bacterium]
MKILYITGGNGPDYLNDLIFHGLYSIFGNDVVDSHCLFYLYRQYTSEEEKYKLYGRGFTAYATVKNDDIDRTDLFYKIKKKYFDIIIYGSIWRCRDYLKIVLENYPANKIICLDGEDHQKIHPLQKKLPYFKRELKKQKYGLYPISFGIPEEKIRKKNREKINKFATVIPGNRETYIFKNERDYYKDYNESYFGFTGKKGGWDCLRHYEILGSYCMPVFKNIEKCPVDTLYNFPKQNCIIANKLALNSKLNKEQYYEILDNSFNVLLNKLTTIKVAEYMIDTLRGLNN